MILLRKAVTLQARLLSLALHQERQMINVGIIGTGFIGPAHCGVTRGGLPAIGIPA